MNKADKNKADTAAQNAAQRAALRFLWSYIRPDIRFVVGATLCAVGVSGMAALVALLLKGFADLIMPTSTHGVPLTPVQKLGGINWVIFGLVGFYAARWFFTYGDTVLFAEAGQRLSVRLRNAIYEHLQGLSLRYFNEQRTGALMSTINNDLPILQGALAGMKDTATAPPQVLFGLVGIFLVSWKLSLVALVAFPLMAYTINRCTRQLRSMTISLQDKLADVNALMAETLGSIRIIQSFSAEKHEIARFRLLNQESKTISLTMTRITSKLKPTIDLIGAVGLGVALWVAGRLVIARQMTPAQLLEFIYLLNLIASAVGTLGGIKTTWEGVRGASIRIWNNVLSVESDVRDAPDAVPLPPVRGTVELRNVAFSYKPDTPVLQDISFTIHPGEVVALVGLSGAGKSTIADLIPRFYDPQEGKILVDGYDIRSVTIESLRRQIAIVPQETVLFGGTIRDNIGYGNPNATEEMIVAAARAANAHEFITDPAVLPDGYRTKVGERGKQLSGGQRQRISIARALLKDPRILILDEATSSLDAESEKLVQAALDDLMQGRTTLVIAHRLSTIVNADKILVMHAGQIVESGTHRELIRRPGGFYAKLYSTFAELPPLLAAS